MSIRYGKPTRGTTPKADLKPLDRAIRTKPVPMCPECGEEMVLRRPRVGQEWEAFWGCSQYPKCRGSRDILPDGTPEPDYEDGGYEYEPDFWGPNPIDSDDLMYAPF